MATFNGTTDTSKPPGIPTTFEQTLKRVRDDDPVTVSTLAEINLYVTGFRNMSNWINFVEANMPPNRYPTEVRELQQLMYKLPSEYDLLERTYPWNPDTPIRWYYVSQYTSTPTQTNRETYIWTDRFTRKVIFIKVAALVSFMRLKKKRFLQALPEGMYTQYSNLYALAESTFEAWIDQARPHCGFSQAALRQRQEGRRGPGR